MKSSNSFSPRPGIPPVSATTPCPAKAPNAAAVLTAIGMAFVKARQLLNRVPTAGPVLNRLPVASAFVIMLLGAGITLNAFGQIP